MKKAIDRYRRIIFPSDLYHPPDINDIDGRGMFIKATIRDAAYYRGTCYVGIATPGRQALRYTPCARSKVIVENDTCDYERDCRVNPQRNPAKLLQMIAAHIGQTMMLGLYHNGSVGNIAYQNGWCWDDH